MGRETQAHGFTFSCRNTKTIDCGSLGAFFFRVDCFALSSDEVFVKCVFYIRRRILFAPQSRSIAFIVGEEQFWVPLATHCALTPGWAGSKDCTGCDPA